MPIVDTEGDCIVLMVGGKVSNRISAPKFSKVVVAYLPNNTPLWPETTECIKKIVDVYAKGARKYERLGEWAERIGWERLTISVIRRTLPGVSQRCLNSK